MQIFKIPRRVYDLGDNVSKPPGDEEVEVVKRSEAEAEIAKIREERAPDIATALFELIQENSEPMPEGRSFFASAIYEIAVAYGEQKHGRRKAEQRIDKALAAIRRRDLSEAIRHLTEKGE